MEVILLVLAALAVIIIAKGSLYCSATKLPTSLNSWG